MEIELDNDEIDMIINCVNYTMEQFCEGPIFIEYKMLIESLEAQKAKYGQGGTFGQFMDWARPPEAQALCYNCGMEPPMEGEGPDRYIGLCKWCADARDRAEAETR